MTSFRKFSYPHPSLSFERRAEPHLTKGQLRRTPRKLTDSPDLLQVACASKDDE